MEILRAWKKEIYDGSKPVGPASITTSFGAVVPTFAAVSNLLFSISGFKSYAGFYEKINPTFPVNYLFKASNYGIGFPIFLNSS